MGPRAGEMNPTGSSSPRIRKESNMSEALRRRGGSPRTRVLVTGGAGFVGSHLCRRLLDRGDNVICVDNYFTGTRDNIAQMLENPYFEAL